MRIETYFTVPEVDPASINGATVIVVDVVRATTTIIEALANGARAIYPTTSTEDAVRLAQSLGRDDTLLCGERKGRKIEGYDLGNSPREFTPEAVSDKKLVMSTTNGTRAISAGQEGARLLPCSFTNLGAVAGAVSDAEQVVVICAGREDRFALDDALCVGHLVLRIRQNRDAEPEMNDATRAACALATTHEPTSEFLASTTSGALLVEIDLGGDLALCAEVDRHDIVAELGQQGITRSGA